MRAFRVYSARKGDRPQHTFGVFDYLVVPEANDARAMALKPSGALAIATTFGGMLPAIKLNNKGMLPAHEVGDERSIGNLTPKFETKQAPVSELEPNLPLNIGLVEAQLSCHLPLHRRMIAHKTDCAGWRAFPHPDPLPQAGEGEEHEEPS